MKSAFKNLPALCAAALAITSLSGCISIKRETEPATTTITTTRSNVPSTQVPASTTVERRTTY